MNLPTIFLAILGVALLLLAIALILLYRKVDHLSVFQVMPPAPHTAARHQARGSWDGSGWRA